MTSLKRKILNKLNFYQSSLRIALVQRLSTVLPSREYKIYDCFLFNHELDLLKLRLAELYDVVDYFIICESRVTFSGKSKRLFYLDNQLLFREYADKIIHFIITDPTSSCYAHNPPTSEDWQRNQMSIPLQCARDHDLVLISDLDEIPRADILKDVYKICYWANCTVFLAQLWCLLFLNVQVSSCNEPVFKSRKELSNKKNNKWLGTSANTAKNIKQRYHWDICSIWGMKWGKGRLDVPIIDNAGWHFSYMGGIEGLLVKNNSNGCPLLFQSILEDLRNRRFNGSDLRMANIDCKYPDIIVKHPELFSHLITPDTSFEALITRIEKLLEMHPQSQSF